MYRILVVDDEDIVRQGLKKIISGMDLKIESIDEAEDGQAALECIHHNKPHIVITDIKMPNLDGLELIQSINALNKSIKFVILSGYGEFAFAQKAMKFGVTDYLLKPFKKDKLYDILSAIISHLDDENVQHNNLNNYVKVLNKLQEKTIKEILQNEYAAGEISDVLRNIGIEFRRTGFLVLSIHINHFEKNDDALLVKKHIDIYFSRPNITFYSFFTQFKHIIYLFNIEQEEAQNLLNSVIARPFRLSLEGHNKTLFAGVSQWECDVQSLPVLVRQAEKALDYRLFKWDSVLLQFSHLPEKSQPVHLKSMYYDAVSTSIVESNQNGLYRSVDELFNFIVNSNKVDPDFVINTLKNLIIHISKYLGNSNNSYYIYNDYIADIDYFYQSSDTILELRDHVKKMLINMMHCCNSQNESVDNSAIGYAIRYIEKNFQKDISLDVVANVVSMNSNYFSTLFRKKTGCSFVKYLQKLRVEESKRLLTNPLKRIYEIANEAGFGNDKYFCKVFKDLTGMTPLEYREQKTSDST